MPPHPITTALLFIDSPQSLLYIRETEKHQLVNVFTLYKKVPTVPRQLAQPRYIHHVLPGEHYSPRSSQKRVQH